MRPTAPYARLLVLAAAPLLLHCSDGNGTGGAGMPGPTPTPTGTPLSLTLESPEADALITSPAVRVAGRAPGASAVTVNGAAATLDAAAFTHTLRPGDGAHTIEVIATNDAGESATLSRTLRVDTTPPELLLEAPERGRFTTEAMARFSGVVSDAVAGLSSLRVDGNPVPADDGVPFETTVNLDRGLTVTELVAEDLAGHQTTQHRAALCCVFADPTSAVTSGVNGHVGPEALQALADEQAAELAARGQAPDEEVQWRDATLTLTPQTGVVDVHAVLIDVTYVVEEEIDIVGDVTGVVRVDRAHLRAKVEPVVTPQQTVAFAMVEQSVELEGFRTDIEGISDFLEELAAPRLQEIAEEALEDELEAFSFIELFDEEDKVQSFELLGTTLVLTIAFTAASVDPGGIFAVADAGFAVEGEGMLRESPGAVVTESGVDTLVLVEQGIELRIKEDLANRALHLIWARDLLEGPGGLLDLGSSPLDTGTLALLLGVDFGDLAPASAPVDLEFVLPLPPVTQPKEAEAEDILVTLAIGDAQLRFLAAPEGAEPVPLLTIALQLDADVGLDEAGDTALSSLESRVDLVDSAVPVTSEQVQGLIGALLSAVGD